MVRRASTETKGVKDFVTQLRTRLGRRRVALEEELQAAERMLEEAEERAQKIRVGLEAELAEERAVADGLRKELNKVRLLYHQLSDELEATQVEKAEELAASSGEIARVTKELAEVCSREADLLARLETAAQDEKRLAKEQKALVNQLMAATVSENNLQTELAQKESTARQVAKDLANEQNSNKSLRAELSKAQVRETEYRRWIGVVEEENEALRQRLGALQELERSETKLASELVFAHAVNLNLDQELQEAQRRVAELLERKKAAEKNSV